MTAEKIGKIEAISLMLIIILNAITLNFPNMITLSTNSGATINLIFISILAIIFTFILCKLFKPFYGKDILDVSEYVGGKPLKTIVGILFIVFFIFITSLSVRYLGNSIKVIYFADSPIVFILLFFLVPALFMNKFGLRAISGVNLIFMPIFILSFIFLLVTTLGSFRIERIFPILGNGFTSTFLVGSTNLFAFTGLAYLYFMPALLKDSKDFKKVSVISIVVSALCLFSSTLSLIMTFPAVTSTDETLSVYLLTRSIEIGQFLERIDALYIFIWIAGFISFLGLTFFYILKIFQKISRIEDARTLTWPLGLIVLGSSLVFRNISTIKFLARWVYKYSALVLIFGVGVVILFLGNIKYRKNNK